MRAWFRQGLASLILAAAVGGAVGAQQASGDGSVTVAFDKGGPNALPIVTDVQYRLAGKIRPLLLFWIGRDNVGGARVVWRRDGRGNRAFELVIGSDPDRAPRSINRWGYIKEELRGGAATILGVMTEADDQSIKEAEARIAKQQEVGPVFKAIRASIVGSEMRSTIAMARVPTNYTYREVSAVLSAVRDAPVTSSRTVAIPSGTRPGFLTALTEMLNEQVSASRRTPGQSHLNGNRTLSYVYNAKLYVLALTSTKGVPRLEVDGQVYTDLLESEVELRGTTTEDRERFTLIYGTTGSLAGIPVFMTYQPRWWFKAELALERPPAPTLATSPGE